MVSFKVKVFSLGELKTGTPFFPPSPRQKKKREEKNPVTGTGSLLKADFNVCYLILGRGSENEDKGRKNKSDTT